MIHVTCPHCQRALRIPAHFAGTRGRCNSCGGPVLVPGVAAQGRSREEILREQQGEPVWTGFDGGTAIPAPDGIRLGAGMLAAEGETGSRAWASLGRMLVLAIILGLVAACVLPALVIGFSAETAPSEPVRKPVLPVARGAAPGAPAGQLETPAAPIAPMETPPETEEMPVPSAPPGSTPPRASATFAPIEDGSGEAAGGTVYVTRTGARYHKATCLHLRESRIAIGLAEARDRGLKPCQACGG